MANSGSAPAATSTAWSFYLGHRHRLRHHPRRPDPERRAQPWGGMRAHGDRLPEDARLCGCGQRGHLEAYASGTAVIKRTREALAAGRKSRWPIGSPPARNAVRPIWLAGEAEAGDELALEIILDTAAYLGRGRGQRDARGRSQRRALGRGHDLRLAPEELGRRFLARVREEVGAAGLPLVGRAVGDRICGPQQRCGGPRRRRPRQVGESGKPPQG